VAGVTTVEFYDTEIERQLARDMDRLRGRLLGLIDVAGLPPDRARPMKELVKSLTYASQRELGETLTSQCAEAEPWLNS
jgi:hypothetical protein